jgi:hypothetical protein
MDVQVFFEEIPVLGCFDNLPKIYELKIGAYILPLGFIRL